MDKNMQRYQLSQDEKQYILTSAIHKGKVRLTCYEVNSKSNNPSVFVGDFSLNDLKAMSSLFYTAPNIEGAQNIINKTIEDQQVSIDSNGQYINILLYLDNENQNDYFSLKCLPSSDYQGEIIYTSPIRLPTKHIKLPTINTRLPTVHLNEVIYNNKPNNYNKIIYSTPNRRIDDLGLSLTPTSNIIHQQTMRPLNNNYPFTQNSPILDYSNNNIPSSPKREQIEYIVPGSPSTAHFNYNAVSSKNNYTTQETLPTSQIESLRTTSSNNDIQKVIELQNETNLIKGEHENLKKQAYKLIEEIKQLRNQISILNNENQNLRNNKGITPNNDQIHEIVILKDQIEKLSNELNNIKEQKKYEFEKFRKSKEEELNSYALKIEQLLENQKNLEIMNNEKDKTINELNLKIQQLLEQNNIEASQDQSKLMSKSNSFQLDNNMKIVKGEILQNNSELEFLTRKISQNSKKITLNLLYKATVDSDKAAAFHKKCDSAKCSIVLIQSGKGKRFGGFTSCDWEGNSIDKKDDIAFVFSLDKMEIYDIIPGQDAIGCYQKFGPVFLGCQIRIYDDAFTKGGTTFKKQVNYQTNEDYELTGGEREFEVKEIEVYGVIIE
jgi:hypothetical protein